MALTGYLFDPSVIHRLARPQVADRVDVLGVQRPLYRCAVTDLEVLRGSVSPADYEARRAARHLASWSPAEWIVPAGSVD
ncbi:PIN domain-containing protein [Jiangella alkaliphila]|uniref:Uncharacterized protein n=1 Tax=Jiangella alkaliphila TaxID=419479 RepID=A0A1H2GV50_9ACTN|nr:hypothetical protein [Jiangella alkaliphila]SDU23422.1 hypothetical protein SAMN04488563_0691 [Jiangella alkaliphila]